MNFACRNASANGLCGAHWLCRNICTCFVYMKSTPGVIAMVEEFREVSGRSNEWEQAVFADVLLRTKNDGNLTHYFLPRRTHPAGYLVREETNIIRTRSISLRPHMSHANYLVGSKDKTGHFEAQGLWEPNQDLPEKCAADGLASARVGHPHEARHQHAHAGAALHENVSGQGP